MTSDDLHDLLRQPDLHPRRFHARAPVATDQLVVHRPAAAQEPAVREPLSAPGDESRHPSDDPPWLAAGIIMAWALAVCLGVGAIVATSIAWPTALAALVTGVVAIGVCAGSFAVARVLR